MLLVFVVYGFRHVIEEIVSREFLCTKILVSKFLMVTVVFVNDSVYSKKWKH